MPKLLSTFATPLAANYLSVFICGLGGLALPICVGIFYPPNVLGAFNQLFSLYIVLSQVAAFGIHLSVLKYVSEFAHIPAKRKHYITSGVVMTTFAATLTATCTYLLRNPIGSVFSSEAVAQGIVFISIGIVFFALNKTLLAALNATERLVEYAYYMALRYIFMFAILLTMLVTSSQPATLTAIFPIAEGLLACILIYCMRSELLFSAKIFKHAIEHTIFGVKVVSGHIMLDLNSRVDILCLGLFLDDHTIGIYSMAAILAEGACQIPLVLRTVHNPKIIRMLAANKHAQLVKFIKTLRFKIWVGMAGISAISIALYPYALLFVTGDPTYAHGQVLFTILMVGVTVASGYLPFSLLLANKGLPGKQSIMVLLLLSLNGIGNMLLIPYFENYGAAFATMISYISFVFLLRFFAKKYIQIHI